MPRPFRQVDVFTAAPYLGNPVAVVLEADGLTDGQMQRLAHWTDLSETTFVLPPQAAAADYRVRIFTPDTELPFAGHPTLGTCHAWLEAGGEPARPGLIRQECRAGVIDVRDTRAAGGDLAFAAPPVLRDGPVDEATAARVAAALNLPPAAITDMRWADNGPGWLAVLLPSAADVLAVRPGPMDPAVPSVGIAGPYPPGAPAAFEVRAFFAKNGATAEDPVTGSLNASLAGWLIGSGRATPPYVASQGTVLGARGQVRVSRDDTGQLWVGGGTVTCVSGSVAL